MNQKCVPHRYHKLSDAFLNNMSIMYLMSYCITVVVPHRYHKLSDAFLNNMSIMYLFINNVLLNILYIYITLPTEGLHKNTQMDIGQCYHENDILAQATRMNKKNFNQQIPNHLLM